MGGLHWNETGWTVDCICGVNYDDGEEMIECETCNVWLHTNCMGSLAKKVPFSCPNCTGGHTRRGGNSQNPKTPSISSYAQRHGVILENANGLYQETTTDYSHVDPLEGVRPCFGRGLWRAVGLTPKVLGKRREDALAALAAKSNSETTKSPSKKKSRKSTEAENDSEKTPPGKSILGRVEEIEQKVTTAAGDKVEALETKTSSKGKQENSGNPTESGELTIVENGTGVQGQVRVSSEQSPVERQEHREASSSPSLTNNFFSNRSQWGTSGGKDEKQHNGVSNTRLGSSKLGASDQNLNGSDSGNSDDSLAGRGDEVMAEGDNDAQNNTGDGPIAKKEEKVSAVLDKGLDKGERKVDPLSTEMANGQEQTENPRIYARTLGEVASLA